ncbi:hypothetical protein AOQ84DRAFT_356016 [Glonium stellatum]|uniref:Uncharacterized protein n=1 Tax=Glonium stellatum TaxID=574774 RepID=A0A8E2EUX4_9PEZI|nr:hypothetical protein AOQ84DRAFT_356016 [Glonium stellatum]
MKGRRSCSSRHGASSGPDSAPAAPYFPTLAYGNCPALCAILTGFLSQGSSWLYACIVEDLSRFRHSITPTDIIRKSHI